MVDIKKTLEIDQIEHKALERLAVRHRADCIEV